jgi:hypothetical protein
LYESGYSRYFHKLTIAAILTSAGFIVYLEMVFLINFGMAIRLGILVVSLGIKILCLCKCINISLVPCNLFYFIVLLALVPVKLVKLYQKNNNLLVLTRMLIKRFVSTSEF